MKKIMNLFRRHNVQKVYVEDAHKIQTGELYSTGFNCGYVKF
ncbi:MAG: hypothetical protein Q4C42_00800 [Clostridia bacterium]|nr:hypothetical protein [Clostridia bacterium]